jgi:tetratricopeptide (TPR) repeat protein
MSTASSQLSFRHACASLRLPFATRLRFANWPDSAALSLLALAAIIPYSNTLLNSFIYDDITQVTNNPYLQSFRHIPQIFTTTVWSYVGAEGVTNYYRPMMTLGYLLCYQIFGPIAYEFHLMNVVLHAGVVCLLYALTRRLFGNRKLAFVASLLFAVHPIHSESVAWIAAVTDLELTFFYLLTFWLFAGLPQSPQPASESSNPASAGIRDVAGPQIMLCLSFILALLSKEQALTLPVLATIYEHFYRRDRLQTTWKQKFSRYGTLWLLAAGYMALRVRFFGSLAPATSTPKYTWTEAILSSFVLMAQYAGKLLWPMRLSAYYVFHKSESLLDWRVVAGMVVVLLTAALFLRLFQDERTRPASLGIVWTAACLGPVLNIRWMPLNAFAERYLYLPSVGFCWLAAWVWIALASRLDATRTPEKASRAASGSLKCVAQISVIGLALIVVAGAVRIVMRNRDWRNEVVLFTRTLAVHPDAYPIRNNLGVVYWTRGDDQAAYREWKQALQLSPHSVIVLTNLGLVATKQGRYQEAVSYFQQAIGYKPDYTNPHLNLGIAYEEMGLIAKAKEQFRIAVKLSPLHTGARNHLGKIYLDESSLAQAKIQFFESARSEPNHVAFDGLGEIYLREHNVDLARRAFTEALHTAPFDSQAHFALAALDSADGKSLPALHHYEAGLQTDPSNPQALAAIQAIKAELRRADPNPDGR